MSAKPIFFFFFKLVEILKDGKYFPAAFFLNIFITEQVPFIYIKKRFLILKSKIKINKQIRQIKQKISGHYLTFPL